MGLWPRLHEVREVGGGGGGEHGVVDGSQKKMKMKYKLYQKKKICGSAAGSSFFSSPDFEGCRAQPTSLWRAGQHWHKAMQSGHSLL